MTSERDMEEETLEAAGTITMAPSAAMTVLQLLDDTDSFPDYVAFPPHKEGKHVAVVILDVFRDLLDLPGASDVLHRHGLTWQFKEEGVHGVNV